KTKFLTAEKQTAPGRLSRFTGFSSPPAQFASDHGLSLQQAVGFQRIDELLLRQHPVLESDRMVRQLVAKQLERILSHHSLDDARRKGPGLLKGFAAL